MTATASDLLSSPHGTALAPLLYVAWADGALEAAEIEALKAAAGDVDDARVAAWLDPAAPPTSTEVANTRPSTGRSTPPAPPASSPATTC